MKNLRQKISGQEYIQMQEERTQISERAGLLREALDVIMKLNDEQLRELLWKMGYDARADH